MRKLFVMVLISIIILSSCTSLYESDDYAVVEERPIPTYESQIYSSGYGGIDVTENILVLCNTGNPVFQMATESNIVESFTANGIRAAAFSDVYNIPLSEFPDDMFDIIADSGFRYILYIAFGEMYAYEYSLGISQMNFDSQLFDMYGEGIPVRIAGTIVPDKNKGQSFADTLEPACECLADGLVDEFMKYIADSFSNN